MKVKKVKYEGEVFGLELIAEDEEEKVMLERFDNGGIKINSIDVSYKWLQITFADLIGK